MSELLKNIKEKIEKIKNNPGALFGLLYPYLLIVIVALGLFYTSNLDFISRQAVPAYIPDTTSVSDLSIQPAKTVPPTNIFEVSEASEELVAEGEKLFKANCSSCHGETGTGNGPASVGLNPAPRNFTVIENWKIGNTLSGIYTTLQEGISGGAMVSYEYLLPIEKISIAHYIRKTFISDAPKDSQSELESLDLTYNLSAGQQLPAQIPVAIAKLIFIKEHELKLNKVKQIIQKIEIDNARGAVLFKIVSSDFMKSFSFLIKNYSWKQSEQNFIDIVTENVNQNGFNGKVFNLNSNEWSSLYSYLNSIVQV